MIDFSSLNLSEELKRLLSSYEVDFVFQPIFSTSSVIGYEALMRPKGLSITEMIYEMKNRGKLQDLELLSFFGAAKAFRDRKLEGFLSINSFPGIKADKSHVVEFSNIFPHISCNLVVELLEYLQPDAEVWEAKRKTLDHYSGIKISLDDFGAGFNDLDAVDMYAPDIIKIDRSLIDGINASDEKQRAMLSYLDMFHRNGMKVLAEGIETAEEYEYLVSIGVDFFQGYYLGMPKAYG